MRTICQLSQKTAVVVILCIASITAAQAEMKFRIFSPDESLIRIVGLRHFIAASGEIDVTAPQRFEAFLNEKRIQNKSAYVYLDSPGGSVLAGLEIGRIIRKFELSTGIGKITGQNYEKFEIEDGGCYSACTFAYVGGVFRFIDKRSEFGLHRFTTSLDLETADALTLSQLTSARIITFLEDMGVSSDLFSFASTVPEDQIRLVGISELKRMNVVNDGFTEPVWSTRLEGSAVYLKAHRFTLYGEQKVLFSCIPSDQTNASGRVPILWFVFSTERRDEEIESMSSYTLAFDERHHPLNPDHISKVINNGYANIFMNLNKELAEHLVNADSISFILRFSGDSPFFLGVGEFPISDGRKDIRSLLANCDFSGGESTVSPLENSSGSRSTDTSLHIENNFDVVGFDYEMFEANLDQCSWRCQSARKCAAFTFNKTQGVCFLKSDADIMVRNKIAISGLKSDILRNVFKSNMRLQSNIDIPGGDYMRYRNSSFAHCLRTCAGDSNCRAFAYVPRLKDCWLKDRIGASATKKGVELGIK